MYVYLLVFFQGQRPSLILEQHQALGANLAQQLASLWGVLSTLNVADIGLRAGLDEAQHGADSLVQLMLQDLVSVDVELEERAPESRRPCRCQSCLSSWTLPGSNSPGISKSRPALVASVVEY